MMEVEIVDAGNTEASSSKKPRKSTGSGANANGTTKRRKVNHACLYCRRSHMHCDENRPCQRCIKRDIGHLCHDEAKPPPPSSKASAEPSPAPVAQPQQQNSTQMQIQAPQIVPASTFPQMNIQNTGDGFQPTTFNINGPGIGTSPWPAFPQTPLMFSPDASIGNEFSVLSEFLESLDDRSFFSTPNMTNPASSLLSSASMVSQQAGGTPGASTVNLFSMDTSPGLDLSRQPELSPQMSLRSAASQSQLQSGSQLQQTPASESQNQIPEHELEHVDPLPPSTKTERFLLTAADQETGTRDERLASVIHAKYEAGMLKPYDYVRGYARLSRWMERNCSAESRQAILQPISVLRPRFRAIAQGLKDIDLVFIEEAFERLLLDYDRVFSAMGIPACLWRRTGEIYKANKQFADLVGIDVGKLRDGRVCIYELMSEDSAVNYWEKYGHVAFDPGQKAVLTSCVLRYKPKLSSLQANSTVSQVTPAMLSRRRRERMREQEEEEDDDEEIFINCCFSFTIRRDTWGIPSMIVGNFIKC
ncbi:hypothetical protein FRC03_003487 [Tulasnella sp. 419]|nr:hypothetical protein FRC03_003487 [Tulasnella sp. 419]